MGCRAAGPWAGELLGGLVRGTHVDVAHAEAFRQRVRADQRRRLGRAGRSRVGGPHLISTTAARRSRRGRRRRRGKEPEGDGAVRGAHLQKRGARPGAWAEDEYTGIGFMAVSMTAADQHEEANAQRDEAENPDYPDFNGADSVPEVDEFDLAEFAVELEAVAEGASGSEAEDSDDDDGATAHGGAPPGAPPDYRAREAAAMAEEESESEREAPRKPRSRYIDDEADNTPEPRNLASKKSTSFFHGAFFFFLLLFAGNKTNEAVRATAPRFAENLYTNKFSTK